MKGQHFLLVGAFDPDEDADRFDVEHPGCPYENIGPPGQAYRVYDCPVSWQIEAMGLNELFIHADDPGRAGAYQERVGPGRHEIEYWQERARSAGPWGPEEWDAGLRLVDPAGENSPA